MTRSPIRSRLFFATLALIFLLLPAIAAAQRQLPPIEQEMSREEFRAAGLDKLSPEELSKLNTWLKRTVTRETTEAARAAVRAEPKEPARRIFGLGEKEVPIESTMKGEFRGYQSGLTYTLENGQVWQQVDATTYYGARMSNPKVRIAPGSLGAWYIRVGDISTPAKVKRIK